MSEVKKCVLVVDDDESIRESLCKVLHTEGYQVVAAANGAEAVEVFCREKPQIDLLLIDLNMPLKNGWATLDRLLEVSPFLPILIVTGQPNQYEMAESAGVCALVEKPIDVPSLLRLIRRLLGESATVRIQGRHDQAVRFHFVRAAGYVRDSWREQRDFPYHHGGLNE
jgi:CheY-like chemotaxis protein